ncbi:MAG: putative HTH transcriptional regulator [Chlamydiales bacterium]|jgi:predicted HTH transcriptional regulator
MNSLDKQIRDRIHAFAEELAQLVKEAAVESVQEALGQSMPKRTTTTRKNASRGGRPKKKAATRRKAGRRIRRSPEQIEAMSGEILAHVKANKGQRLEQIAVDLGMDTADMKRPVSLMIEAKKLSTKGQKRGTTYYAGKAKGAGRKKATNKKVTRRKKA